MKKRVLLIMMAVVMATSLTACGGSDSGKGKGVSKVEETDEEDVEEDVEKEDEAEKEESKKDKDNKENTSGTPVIGNDVEDYDGFEYLTAYKITGEESEAIVYAPADEYAFGGDTENYIGAESNGVYVEFEIEPYVQYEQENYSAEENMEYYVNDWYEYRLEDSDCMDVEEPEVKTNGDEGAYATMARVEYDTYDEECYYIWEAFYLYQTDDKMIMAEIEVDSLYSTEGAEDIIAELETYLGVKLGYDADELQAMAGNVEPTDKPDIDDDDDTDGSSNADGTFSTDYWTFELPEGWAEDPSMSGYDEYAYAPNGDVGEAECGIMIQSEYLGEDTSVLKELEDDEMVTFLETFMPEDIENPVCSVVGDTAVGYTLKAEFVYEGVNVEAYFIFDDEYAHTVMAMQYGDDEEVFDAAEQIVYTAEAK